ncbi:MAG: HesB/IscA family protein [Acidobacteriota bacterium]
MIEVTPRAIKQLLKMMEEQGKEGFSVRVGVKASGCSGMEYVMDFADEPQAEDQVIDSNGLRILVDPQSAPYLRSITLDWGGGLLDSGFTFSNPDATKTCGCGKSFNV